MKKVANTRIVFDRRNTASKKIAAPVYIEVTFDKVRNFYNTGIKVRKDQFRNDRVCNCGQQIEYNKTIDIVEKPLYFDPFGQIEFAPVGHNIIAPCKVLVQGSILFYPFRDSGFS